MRVPAERGGSTLAITEARAIGLVRIKSLAIAANALPAILNGINLGLESAGKLLKTLVAKSGGGLIIHGLAPLLDETMQAVGHDQTPLADLGADKPPLLDQFIQAGLAE